MEVTLSVVPLHHNKKYLSDCCKLLNDEWKRSENARMHSLKNSSDTLPTSLILLKNDKIIGHLKLSPIQTIKSACFVESVVIEKGLRGKGFGTVLMKEAEEYCQTFLKIQTIYLSTKGQEGFYSKLGYTKCAPISIYGSYMSVKNNTHCKIEGVVCKDAPKAPPLPPSYQNAILKTYMKKEL